jgi:transposase
MKAFSSMALCCHKSVRTIDQVTASIVTDEKKITVQKQRAGRLILATNVLDSQELSADDALKEYKAQQGAERGFRFLKDPLFFASSVFLKTPKRINPVLIGQSS